MNDFPGLTYEGTMSADGNSMSGTMTYARRSLPLALERAKPEAEWAIPAAPAKIAPMAPDAKPDVEVATVKPTQPGNQICHVSMQGGTLVIKDLTLGFLMSFAYDLPTRQIAGKPGWMDTDKWDIEAKPDTPGMPNESQIESDRAEAARRAIRAAVSRREAEGGGLRSDREQGRAEDDEGCRRVVIAEAIVVPLRRAGRAKPQLWRISRRTLQSSFWPAGGGQDGTRRAVGLHDEVDAG